MILNIMVMKIQDIHPKKVISWTIHYFQVGIVVGVTESLLTYNTSHRAKLGEVVWVGVCLAVVVLLLVAPNHNPIKSCFYKTIKSQK